MLVEQDMSLSVDNLFMLQVSYIQYLQDSVQM